MSRAGEEETDLDVGEMVRKGEVAWLSAEEMKAAAEPMPSTFPPPENGELSRGYSTSYALAFCQCDGASCIE